MIKGGARVMTIPLFNDRCKDYTGTAYHEIVLSVVSGGSKDTESMHTFWLPLM